MERSGSQPVDTEGFERGRDWYGFGTGRITLGGDEQDTGRRKRGGIGLKNAGLGYAVTKPNDPGGFRFPTSPQTLGFIAFRVVVSRVCDGTMGHHTTR